MSDMPRLSVIIICYNHGAYIEQAVQSALDQRTDFPFEVIVLDDASTDNTQMKLSKFEAHPNIRLVLREENKGPNHNFLHGIKISEGEYYANLEGDDYWMDRDKLQKQVEYMENHPDVSCVGTNAYVKYEPSSDLYETYLGRGLSECSSEDFIIQPLAHTCTMVYRKKYFALLPDIDLQPYDSLMHVLYAQQGRGVKLPDYTSVYRVHDKGMWTSMNLSEKHEGGLSVREYLVENKHITNADEKKSVRYFTLTKELESLIDQGQIEKSIYLLDQFDGDKELYLAQFQLARLLMRVQRWPQFLERLNWLKNVREYDPGLSEIECQFYWGISKYQKLLEFSRTQLARFPDDIPLHNFYLRALMKTGSMDELQNHLNSIEERFLGAPPLAAMLAASIAEAENHLATTKRVLS